MNERSLITAFLIYTLLWEGLVWVGGTYIILDRDWSPWWFVFLLLLSTAQLKPRNFRELLA